MFIRPQGAYGKPLFKAAGTSFEGRPELLRRLYGQNPWRTVRVYRTSYEGKAAIALYDENTGDQLGWVPKAHIPSFPQDADLLIGEIVLGRDLVGLRLYRYHKPSPSLYWPLKRSLEALRRPLPPYNEAAWLHARAVFVEPVEH